MSKRRSTYGKLDRERAKKAKAAAKRARRDARSADTDEDEQEEQRKAAAPTVEEEEVLARLARVHERYDAGEITFLEFEEKKKALVALIEVD